jgi:hypothetical protein
MPDNSVPAASVPGILGIMVLCVTLLFVALAVSSLLPRPDWLYKAFTGRVNRGPVPGSAAARGGRRT